MRNLTLNKFNTKWVKYQLVNRQNYKASFTLIHETKKSFVSQILLLI